MFGRISKPATGIEALMAESMAEVKAEKLANALQQMAVLDAIGETTDDIADRTLHIVDRLPQPERDLFMRKAMRHLVLQTIVSKTDFAKQHGDASFMADAERLGQHVLSDFGSGLSALSNVGFEEAVIDIALPSYQQAALFADKDMS